MQTPRLTTEHQVMFFDTDCGGVVHNTAYLRIIEVTRTLLAEQLGMGLVEMSASGQYPVVVRTEIDYRRPAKLGDKLIIEGWLDEVERMRFWCAFRVTLAGAPEKQPPFVECRQMLAVVQMPAGRPVRLPVDWAEKYAHLRPA